MSFIGLAHKNQPLLCDLFPSTETKGATCWRWQNHTLERAWVPASLPGGNPPAGQEYCLGLDWAGNKLLFYYAIKGAALHNTLPFTLGFYPGVLKAARVGGVNTLSNLNIILSPRILSWLWVTRDLLPILESVCGVLRSHWRMVSDMSYMPEP